MTLLASIQSLFETYDCPFFKKPPTIIQTILIPQQLSQWVHQIYFQQKKLNQLGVIKLVQHPLESVKPNIACSIMYTIIKEKVQEVCQHIRSLLLLSYKKLKNQKQHNSDLKHQTNSWNMNFKRFKKQNLDNSERKIWGPIGHLICSYHNYLLQANKQVYDLWKLLYQCSQVKDLEFKTLQNSLNETILDALMKQFPNQMNPRQIMPTISSFEKHDFIFKQMWGFQKRKIVVQFHSKPQIPGQQKKSQKLTQIFNSVPKKVQKGQVLQPEKPIALPKSEIGTNTSLNNFTKYHNQNKISQKQTAKKKVIQQQLKFLEIQQQIQQLDSTAKLKILQKILATMKQTNESKDPISTLSTNLLNTLSPTELQFLGRTMDQNEIKQNQELDKYCQNVSDSSSQSSSEQQILMLTKGETSELIFQSLKQQIDKKINQDKLQSIKFQSAVTEQVVNTIQKPSKNVSFDYFQKSDLQMEKRLKEPGRNFQDQKKEYKNYLKFKLGTTIYQQNGEVTVHTTDPDKMHPIFDQICQIQANQRFPNIESKSKKLSISSNINPIENKIKQEKKQVKTNQKSLVNKSKPIQKKQKPSKNHHNEELKNQQNSFAGHEKPKLTMQIVADRLYQLAKQKQRVQQSGQLNQTGKGYIPKSIIQYIKQKHQNSNNYSIQTQESFKCYLDNHSCTVTSKKMKIDSKIAFQWAKLDKDSDVANEYFQKTKTRLIDSCFKFQSSENFEKIIDQPEDFQTDKQAKKKKKNKKKNKKKKNQDKSNQLQQNSKVISQQQMTQQLRQKKQILNRCEIQQIMEQQEEIQKQREQELLMEKKIAQYQCRTQSKQGQEKSKKNKLNYEFNQNQQNLFLFLESLQIKEQARQKCVVTQENLKNICKKTNLILSKKSKVTKSLSQQELTNYSQSQNIKISSCQDLQKNISCEEVNLKVNREASKEMNEIIKINEKSEGKKQIQNKGKQNSKKKSKR